MVTLLAALFAASAAGLVAHAFLVERRPTVGASKWRVGPVPGQDVTPIQFWATVIGAGVITFALVFGLTGLVAVSLVPAIVVATLPKAYYDRKRSARVAAVQQAWPDGLRDILASVRSGSSLPASIESLAAFGPAPLREAFHGFGVYARSLGVASALELIRDDLADPTTDRVIEVLVLAHERGGSVVPEILADLADATTRDLWTMEQVRTEALEQKINSRIVFVLPWLVLVAMTARNGAFRDFYSTPIGVMVVAVGGALSLIGIGIATRMSSQPAEPRVLGGPT